MRTRIIELLNMLIDQVGGEIEAAEKLKSGENMDAKKQFIAELENIIYSLKLGKDGI